MQALILAGGRGTRLHPYTTVFPKPLMPVGDYPILEIILRQLKGAGITDVILAVGYLSQLLQAFFQKGERLGLNISYSFEERALGTAGPIALAMEQLEDDFLVMNGDLMTTLKYQNLIAFHQDKGAAATIGIYQRDVKVDFGVLETDAEKAAETAARLEALPEVKRVIGLDDLVPEDQFDKADLIDISSIGLGLAFSDADNTNAAPDPDVLDDLLDRLDSLGTTETERLASALRTMASTPAEVQADAAGDIFAYWPDQYDLLREQIRAQPFEVDDLPEALRDRYIGAEGQYRLQIEPVEDLRSDEARARFVDAVRGADPRAAGPARSVLQSGRVISVAMVQAMALAFIAVTMLLWLVLRDIWLVGIILFCLSLAGVLTAATGVLIGMPFNFANIIVLPLLIGVGADSGIHLGLRAHERGSSASVFRTSTPRAVFYSAVTTIATFGTLSFSAHQGVASMGTLLTIAIAFTLICTVIVQPWLVEWLAEVRRKRAITRQRGLSFPIGDGGSGD